MESRAVSLKQLRIFFQRLVDMISTELIPTMEPIRFRTVSQQPPLARRCSFSLSCARRDNFLNTELAEGVQRVLPGRGGRRDRSADDRGRD